jgi:hypothetical protein
MKNTTLKQMAVLLVAGVTILATQNTAHAQLGGLLKKKGADNTSGGGGIDKNTFGKSAEKAVDDLLAARIAFLEAKAKMMDAIGVKTDSVAKASEALRIKEGSTSDKVKRLETASKQTEGTDKEFAAKLAESKDLSAESKQKFAEGAAKFIEGVILEKEQIENIQKLVEQGQSLVQSASPLEKAGIVSMVKPVTTMATIVPGDVKEGTSTLSKIFAFAKNQKVTIPGADKATDKLGGL